MRRSVLRKTVLILLCATCLLIEFASNAFGQNMEETRTLALWPSELSDVLTELFAAASVTRDRDVPQVLALVNSLAIGDEIQLRFRTVHPGDAGELYLSLRRDIDLWVSARSSGIALDSAAAVFRRRALAMLHPMNGDIVVHVQDGPAVDGSSRPSLIIETAERYPCTDYRIEADISDSSGNIQLNILGIMPPLGLCGPAPTPAFVTRPTPATRGSYHVDIVDGERSDRYQLLVSDSSLRLMPVQTSFSRADTLEHWRRPHRSFHVTCDERSTWCEALHAWLADRPDIRVQQFPTHGVPPYWASAPGDAYYLYETAESRAAVKACLEHLDEIAPVGLFIVLEDWDGRTVHAMFKAGDLESPGGPPPFPSECMK